MSGKSRSLSFPFRKMNLGMAFEHNFDPGREGGGLILNLNDTNSLVFATKSKQISIFVLGVGKIVKEL